jgi:hypothetical protein
MVLFGIEGNHTGFIPCYKCCKKIEFKKDKIPTLICNRINKGKFPRASKMEMTKENLHKIFLLDIEKYRKEDDKIEYDSDSLPELILIG